MLHPQLLRHCGATYMSHTERYSVGLLRQVLSFFLPSQKCFYNGSHWRPNLPIIVETDALDYALVAILSIQEANGDIHPIAFHSRNFSAMGLNYDVHDKELLAIFNAFKI